MFRELFFWYLILFPVILPTVIYIAIFREFPLPNPKRDWAIISNFLDDLNALTKVDRRVRKGDLYDDDDTISADAGPSIRHPKNVDRAYSGSAERFHDGGG